MTQTIAQNASPNARTSADRETMLQGQDVLCLQGFVARTYQSAQEIPRDTANDFLLEYVATQAAVYERENGVKVDAPAHIKGFWANIDRVLPPQGSYYLVWDAFGQLVGTGALRRVDSTTGEMKHLYVRPEARGSGLGRWLVEQRMRDARSMGLKSLIADTVRGNIEMPALYAKLGFEETEPNARGASVSVMPELAAGLRYFRKDI
ncbi:MAG: GNAT family N-acetyltransferase [Pseudomonadota bacterium]